MLRRLLALAALFAVLSTGCASRAWPSAGSSVADPTFVRGARGIVTVDILPLDLAVWTEDGATTNPAELRSRAEVRIMNAALTTLSGSGYGIEALIDWNGEASGRTVLPRADLIATTQALAGYGAEVDQYPGTLPELPSTVPLAQTIRADATLYVGGWAYVPAPRQSTASKVAKGIAIGLVVVALVGVVIVIAAAASDKSSSSSGSAKKSGGSSTRTGGSTLRDHRDGDSAKIRDHRDGATIRDHRQPGSRPPATRDDYSRGDTSITRDHRVGSGTTSATLRDHRGPQAPRGRRNVSVDLSWMTVDDDLGGGSMWRAQSPSQGLDTHSQLYLEMTLIDNRTGRVLWHSHQAFPANAAKPGETERAARVLLSSLPAR